MKKLLRKENFGILRSVRILRNKRSFIPTITELCDNTGCLQEERIKDIEVLTKSRKRNSSFMHV
ncbi:MAG: hypothetical protein ACSLEL_00180 [Candidatus Malihini olakiniferum]